MEICLSIEQPARPKDQSCVNTVPDDTEHNAQYHSNTHYYYKGPVLTEGVRGGLFNSISYSSQRQQQIDMFVVVRVIQKFEYNSGRSPDTCKNFTFCQCD